MNPEEELNLEADPEVEEAEEEQDRGDVIDKEVNAKNLKAVVAEESETEEVEEAEEETEDDAAAAGKSKTIPYGRFKEVNDRARQLEEENKALKAAQQTAPAKAAAKEEPTTEKPKLDSLYEKSAAAMMEGDVAEYTKIQRQISEEIRNQTRAEVREELSQENARNSLIETAVELIEQYPILDDKSDKANPAAIRMVRLTRDDYIRAGKDHTEALRLAVAEVAPLYAEKVEAEEEEQEDEAPKVWKASARKLELVKKNAAANTAQPPNTPGVGNRATAAKLDLEKMSESDFEKMPESEKKRLRGD